MSAEAFIQATRSKFRFQSPQGSLSVEDLWDIPLTSTKANVANLDDVAKGLHKKIKESEETESFVTNTSKKDESVVAQFEIVKHIISIRLEELEAAKTAKANKDKKQMIMGIIAQKKNDALLGASLEELEKMVGEL